MNLIELENLAVHAGDVELLAPLSLALKKGERLTILGQTGSGKSLLVQAIMGTLPKGLSTKGTVRLFGEDITVKQRQSYWGTRISMLPQEPWNALDPLMPVGRQLEQTYALVDGQSSRQARESARYTFSLQGLQHALHKRVDQLSGGMAQRVAIACATAGGAPVLLADEPTKGLDVSRRDQVVQQLTAQAETGALITITHDVAVARQAGGRMMVIKSGELVEAGDSASVLGNPTHPFTQTLVAADPASWQDEPPPANNENPVLTALDLAVGRDGIALTSPLDFTLHRGEVVGVVGDSGCGKSTLGDTLLGLVAPHAGRVQRHVRAPKHQWQKLYQDPTAAVSHTTPLRVLLNDVVQRHRVDTKRIPPLMAKLGLDTALLERKADSVSGGELQRFCLLRALLLDPVFLFADEPTSRLDPVTARQVSKLLVDLAGDTGCAVIMVSHDPQLIAKRCSRVIRLTA